MGPFSRTFLILSIVALVGFHINARGENEAADLAFMENGAEQIEDEYDEDAVAEGDSEEYEDDAEEYDDEYDDEEYAEEEEEYQAK